MKPSILTIFLPVSCALLTAQPALAFAPKESLRLEPASKWIVEYQNDGCTLVRSFGEGKDQSILRMARFGPGSHFRFTVGGNPFRPGLDDRQASVQFGANEKPQALDYLPGSLGEEIPALVFTGSVNFFATAADQKKEDFAPEPIREIDPARLDAITNITLAKPLRRPVTLATGPMAKPVAALSKCVDNLMTSWGIDAEKHKNLKSYVTPKDDPARWVRSSEYPIKMIKQGQPALVEFRLAVDETGKVTGCHIQETTRPKEFDNAVCQGLIKRASFTPAVDDGGNPVKSFWRSRVLFQLPS